MNELDLVWSQMLASAVDNADLAGRSDLAEYLRLKATNDAIRSAGVKWLLESVIEIAAEAGVSRPLLKIERIEPHSFRRGNSEMRGELLSISLGVRCLHVQTGWTRTPPDGVMTAGALAAADILHFGMTRHNVEMRLVHGDALPCWRDAAGAAVKVSDLARHVDILLM